MTGTAQGFEVNPSTSSGAQPFHADDLTIDGLLALVQRTKLVWGDPGAGNDASAAHPLPVTDAAAETSLTTLAAISSTLTSILAGEGTHSDLAAILAKLTADPATQTTLAAVLAKLPASPALDATLAAFVTANHTDLAAVLAKLSADPATQTTLAAILTKVNASLAVTGTFWQTTQPVSGTVALSASADQVSTLTDGRKTVTTPGTAVAIRASLACKWVTVTALLTNTKQVNAGGSGALATVGSDVGTPLNPGDSVTIPISNANLVFVDAQVAGEGVSFTVGS